MAPIRVVVLTATLNENERIAAFLTGAEGIIVSPVYTVAIYAVASTFALWPSAVVMAPFWDVGDDAYVASAPAVQFANALQIAQEIRDFDIGGSSIAVIIFDPTDRALSACEWQTAGFAYWTPGTLAGEHKTLGEVISETVLQPNG